MSDGVERFDRAWVLTGDRIQCLKGDLWREGEDLMFYRDRRLTAALRGEWGRTLRDARKMLLHHLEERAETLRAVASSYENQAMRLREKLRAKR